MLTTKLRNATWGNFAIAAWERARWVLDIILLGVRCTVDRGLLLIIVIPIVVVVIPLTIILLIAALAWLPP